MNINKFIVTLIFFPTICWGQIGPVNIIDSSFESAGVTKFISIDLDNDGDNELITSFTGSSGKIAFYDNQSLGLFSSMNIIDSFPFSKGIAAGDFNGDSWNDLVSIGGINMEARIYFNNLGILNGPTNLDSSISIQVNDVVVADFDGNNSDDIVIIGQHSIDLYRNNGTGNFSKEVILSTSTSPLSLECLDLSTVDIDGDGDMDLVCGETEGLVIYINNGNAIFSPNYYSSITEVLFLVHPMDIDDDGDKDVVAKNNAGEIKWFSNDGNGIMTYEATLSTIPNLKSLSSIDYNNDGLEDIYASYTNNISIFENDTNHNFNSEVTVHQDNGLLMGPVQIANIDNLGGLDYIWSGGNNTISFHINQTSLSIETAEKNQSNLYYPNPTTGLIKSKNSIESVRVFDSFGKEIYETSSLNELDLTTYPSGLYFLLIKDGDLLEFHKIIKN